MSKMSELKIYNRKARFKYEVIKNWEAGIMLEGKEIKSIRDGGMNISESFARIIKGEVFLFNCHIAKYNFDSEKNYNPTKDRKLLLHRKEIKKIEDEIKMNRGFALVPLSAYLKRGKIKIDLAMCKGRRNFEKKQYKKEQDIERSVRRDGDY